MTITHLGTTAVQSYSSTINTTLPAGVAAGDLLVFDIVVGSSDTLSVGYPAGTTEIYRDPANQFRSSHILVAGIYDGLSTYTFTNSLVRGSSLIVNAWRGVNQTTPIAASGNTGPTGNVGSIDSPALTVVNANSIEYVSIFDLDGASRVFTSPASVTEILNRESPPSLIMYQRAVAAGTTTPATTTVVSNAKMSLVSIVINADEGSGNDFTLLKSELTVNSKLLQFPKSVLESFIKSVLSVNSKQLVLSTGGSYEDSILKSALSVNSKNLQFVNSEGATISLLDFRNNPASPIWANTTGWIVTITDLSDDSIIFRNDNVTIDVNSDIIITNAAFVSGNFYQAVIKKEIESVWNYGIIILQAV